MNGDFYNRLKASRAAVGSPEGLELEECVLRTVTALQSSHTDGNRPGMLLGKIQSGKTRAFLGVIAAAFDEGFDVAVVLTKGTKTLAQQTVNRIANEYREFRDAEEMAVYDIMTVPNLTSWEIDNHKLIFVAKKEANNMRRLVNLFSETHRALAGKRVLIVDDEADFASIRFSKKKGTKEIEQGRIADRIDELRRELTNPAVLQVTATPYSLYLQPEEYETTPDQNFRFEPKRPAFTQLVPIHGGYVGGDHYFGDHDESHPEFYLWHPVAEDELTALKKEDRRRVRSDEALTSKRTETLRHALVTFVTAASIRRLQQRQTGKKLQRYSMIVHVETARASHAWQHTVAQEIISGMSKAAMAGDPTFGELVRRSIDDLERSISAGNYNMPDHDAIAGLVKDAFVKSGVVTEKVNSDNDVQALLDENAELRLRTPFNVFIGGQILDRGITVPNLLGFFYGRSPKKMQQDTVLQHARMYGNRPREDLAVSRFYTTAGNYNALKSVHEFDSALRHAFETGAHDRGVAFVMRDLSNRVIPCAPSKILVSDIVSLRPNGALLPVGFQTKAKTSLVKIMSKVDALVPADAVDSNQPIKFKCKTAVQILDLIEEAFEFEDGYSFDWEACRAAVEYFSKIVSPAGERGDCWIIAPKGRTIARRRASGRYSDAPLSYQERAAFRSLGGGLPILALLGQEGRVEDGWRDCPFWWPVLVSPAQAAPSIFASSVRDSSTDDEK
ncbi:Z1 domain-containing protein [Gemmobacter caeni]|uniref:Z1 domain-containing protein n=1 Tax=Gemmobacter caeni TaxID=589035 RepID=A0A2T5ZYB2_9RHOB|nr:Z1 domain-containing protein [Gemmobacter caeni]PTX36554.1 Z1 domain-containing protein [Gemmobacter caeni]TWI89727.1 Z1 domain-containing protein [Gemmobacter caeni]